MNKYIALALAVTVLVACSSRAFIGVQGSGARVELGSGASIVGPITFRADNGQVFYSLPENGQIALGR
jgi:membrane-bound lytic murein transglycosylase